MMEESLDLLLKLQDLDLEINMIRGKREGIPAQIQEIEQRMNDARLELSDLETQVKAARLAIRESEGRVAQIEDKTNKYKQQLIGVKTNREYSALLTEIEGVKREKTELEELIIGKMEEVEKLSGEMKQAREKLKEAEQAFGEDRDRLSSTMKELDDEIAVRRQKRENISVRVKRPILTLYERIMGSRVNHAVVALRHGSCSGCHAIIPLQKVADIRKCKEIHTCENCGRILYYDEENGNGK